MRHISKRILTVAVAAALLWFFVSYLLEPTLPFLLGLALALLAEPAVRFLQRQLTLLHKSVLRCLPLTKVSAF